MNISKEAIQELQKTIAPVVENLGQGGEVMYEVYRRQVYVDAFTNYGGYVLFGAYCLAILMHLKKSWQKYSEDKSDKSLMVFYWLCVIVVIFLILWNVTNMAARLINPDYYVIQDILLH